MLILFCIHRCFKLVDVFANICIIPDIKCILFIFMLKCLQQDFTVNNLYTAQRCLLLSVTKTLETVAMITLYNTF